MTDIYDTVSNALSAKVALDYLEGFLNTLAGLSFGTKIRGSYEQKGTRLIELRFDSATQDRIDRYVLGDRLRGHEIANENAAIIPGRNYYIVVAVVRSNSISITARGQNQKEVNIKGEASMMASGSISVSTDTSRESELKFNGDKKLVFGVELCELTYDTQYHKFKLDSVTESFRVRGNRELKNRKVIKSAFIGDPTEGDMFVDII